jgi:hypothetical protein
VAGRSYVGGSSGGATAAQLIDANTRVSYNQKLLLMDSLPVGTAYGLLLKVTQARLSRYRDEAWKTAVMASDEEVPQSTLQYPYDNEAEWELCILAMQRELKLWDRAGHRDTLRECADLNDVRARK